MAGASVGSLQRGNFLLRVWSVNLRQGCPRRGDEIGRGHPVWGTHTGIVTGRVLRDASARTPRLPAALSFGVGHTVMNPGHRVRLAAVLVLCSRVSFCC